MKNRIISLHSRSLGERVFFNFYERELNKSYAESAHESN